MYVLLADFRDVAGADEAIYLAVARRSRLAVATVWSTKGARPRISMSPMGAR